MASWEQTGQADLPQLSAALPAMPASTDIWQAVDQLVDRAPRPSDLIHHKLHLLGARRFRETGRLVPRDFQEAEQASAILTLLVPLVLERVRAAYDRTIVVMKGPEIAVGYPEPMLRPFRDLDLLVPDAAEAQAALLAAGFVTAGSPEPYVDIHHLQPVQWPGAPLIVELHDRPKWVAGLREPSRAELLASAVPGSTGIEGVLALKPELHAMAVAAHSWAHRPLARLIHLVDLAVITAGLDRGDLDGLASELGMRRVWRTSIKAVDAMLDGSPTPLALRLWARNLNAVREPTVVESHLGRWLPPWWALPPRQALSANAFTISRELGPMRGETWRTKLRRMLLAIRNATRRVSDHQGKLKEEGS